MLGSPGRFDLAATFGIQQILQELFLARRNRFDVKQAVNRIEQLQQVFFLTAINERLLTGELTAGACSSEFSRVSAVKNTEL